MVWKVAPGARHLGKLGVVRQGAGGRSAFLSALRRKCLSANGRSRIQNPVGLTPRVGSIPTFGSSHRETRVARVPVDDCRAMIAAWKRFAQSLQAGQSS